MTDAGGSARREYERRLSQDRLRRRRNLRWSVPTVAVAPFVVYGLVRAGALLVDRQAGVGVVGPTAHLLALVLAGSAALHLAIGFWGARQTTGSWRKGSEGEVRTAKALDRLPDGFVVLHDLAMLGSKANIDHLVIGPTGVFTVETKHYSSEVVIGGGVARRAGRSMAAVVDQAGRQAIAVQTVLGCEVGAVVCVQGAGVTVDGWFTKPVVDGVRFCSGRRLRHLLTRLPRALADEDVAQLGAQARQRLLPTA